MKIATMVRGYIPAPRPADMVYAPIDLAVAISEQLTKRGHEVTYFGPNGTHLRAEVETRNLRPLAHNYEEFAGLLKNIDALSHHVPGMWDAYLVREMFERARQGEFDLLHFHHPESALPYVHLYPDVPVIYTLHDPINPLFREVLEMYQTPSQYFVSISENQRIPAPDLPYVATVYNGIDTDVFELTEEKDDYLLFAGRINQQKGVKEAIQVAQQTDHRLLILGPIYADQQEYFDQHVKPHLNEKILYLGFVERETAVRYFQKAKAFLMPIQWEEPFGLTMAEAMACGTPVIAMRRGSVPEVVADKKTGYIVDSVTEMAEAVAKVKRIKPENCRKHVEERFSTDKMVDGYEAAFQKAIEQFQQYKNSAEVAAGDAKK
ncbi:MAG TPA: glycosyltransferase family 4 protein [Verrucomicrobiae bacterium]|nr:glycosyltransferase family 4 protein [Verrucomicrobiae bacterium]